MVFGILAKVTERISADSALVFNSLPLHLAGEKLHKLRAGILRVLDHRP